LALAGRAGCVGGAGARARPVGGPEGERRIRVRVCVWIF